jgi:hypothetical protein
MKVAFFMLIEREEILKVIRAKFADKEFTMGDIFYTLSPKWDKAKFGSIFSTMKFLTKQKVLKYEMKIVGTPLMNSKMKRRGAAFRLVA